MIEERLRRDREETDKLITDGRGLARGITGGVRVDVGTDHKAVAEQQAVDTDAIGAEGRIKPRVHQSA